MDPWPLSEKLLSLTPGSRHHTPVVLPFRRYGWIHRDYIILKMESWKKSAIFSESERHALVRLCALLDPSAASERLSNRGSPGRTREKRCGIWRFQWGFLKWGYCTWKWRVYNWTSENQMIRGHPHFLAQHPQTLPQKDSKGTWIIYGMKCIEIW